MRDVGFSKGLLRPVLLSWEDRRDIETRGLLLQPREDLACNRQQEQPWERLDLVEAASDVEASQENPVGSVNHRGKDRN